MGIFQARFYFLHVFVSYLEGGIHVLLSYLYSRFDLLAIRELFSLIAVVKSFSISIVFQSRGISIIDLPVS